MRTTIDLPDDLFREAKATAALRGQSLRELVEDALRQRLDALHKPAGASTGWRSVFGKAKSGEIDAIQSIIDDEFSVIDPQSWR